MFNDGLRWPNAEMCRCECLRSCYELLTPENIIKYQKTTNIKNNKEDV